MLKIIKWSITSNCIFILNLGVSMEFSLYLNSFSICCLEWFRFGFKFRNIHWEIFSH